ncbi:hypothetical protein [Paenibacillus ferrarius]|nr:hypothetical protein [Paenibacillus ferrarius]
MKIEEDVLKHLYLELGLTAKEIAEKYNGYAAHNIKYYLRQYGLVNNKYKINHVLSEIQKDLIIGSALGDGGFDYRNDSTSLNVSHAENQKSYCQMKFELIKDICNHRELRFKDRSNEKDGHKRQSQFTFNTKYIVAMNEFYKMSRYDLMDNLNSNSMMIWLLDDGHKYEPRGKNKNSSYELSVGRFTLAEVAYAQKIINDKFNLNTGLKYNEKWKNPQYTITFDVEQSYLLSQIISNCEMGYIAKESMSYKLIDTIHINRITQNYKVVQEMMSRSIS